MHFRSEISRSGSSQSFSIVPAQSQTGEPFFWRQFTNYGKESYNIGDGLEHIGTAVEDVAQVVENLHEAGFKVIREPGPVKGGHMRLAFVEDPT
jgi:lactoylglutathione lyase